MVFTRYSSEKLRKLLIFLIIFVVLVCMCYSFNLRKRDILNAMPSIKPIDQSLLFPIAGRIHTLGKAHPIYIINLPSRFDRRTTSIALVQTIDLEAYLVPAYSIHSPEVFLFNRNRNKLFFTLNELACWASHMSLWMIIANQTSTWSIIFEDDIDVEIDIHSIVKTFPQSIWNEADLIYLGHCTNPPGKLIYQSTKTKHRIHQALHPSCTHAYAIRSQAARNLISLLANPIRAIDDSIVELVNNDKLIAYSIHPPLAIQNPVTHSNPSNINLADRQSLLYRIKFFFYTLLQWWNGVELCQKLKDSALQRANLTQANQWRKMYERGIWKS